MIGAIVGDIVGSRFERNNIKTKQFELFTAKNIFTDDSVMSLAIAQAILECDGNYESLSAAAIKNIQDLGREYPDCGYGGMFFQWLFTRNPQPYNSYGNGAAMRVSACGYAARDLEEVKFLANAVTAISHNHSEGLKGAESTAICVYLARTGVDKSEIQRYIRKHYYPINFTLNGIRETYRFSETCQNTVPQAIVAFLEADSFEDTIRNAISIGGDSDTLAAIAGSIAEAYYGVPDDLRSSAIGYLEEPLTSILTNFELAFPPPAKHSSAG